jgi:hypothetical protein
MKHFVLISEDGKRQKLRVRSIILAPGEAPKGDPTCVWCTRAKSEALLDICQSGFFHDFYQTLCLCPDCGRVTCLQYRLPHENEPDHTNSPIFEAAEKAEVSI